MVVACRINVGIHLISKEFSKIGRSETPLKLAIIDGFPFSQTFDV